MMYGTHNVKLVDIAILEEVRVFIIRIDDV